MKSVLTILFVLVVSIILLNANKFLQNINVTLNQSSYLNSIIKYQIFALIIAIIAIFITLKISPNSKPIFSFGNLSIIAQKEKWLGISGKTSWKSNAIQLSFFISIATAIFMFLAVKYTGSLDNFKWSFIPFVILISLTNSFSEEMIYRFAVNGNLPGITSKINVLIISAILFGLPHYFGYPSGFIGVIMSGLLGYILSKATYETQGFGVAWIIHFIQDIIIFTALFMMNTKG